MALKTFAFDQGRIGMADEPTTASAAGESLQATRVYAMAAICLVVGLAIGYLFRGPQSPAAPKGPVANVVSASPHAGVMGNGHAPSPDEMKQMADKQAAPLIEKLKNDPNN